MADQKHTTMHMTVYPNGLNIIENTEQSNASLRQVMSKDSIKFYLYFYLTQISLCHSKYSKLLRNNFSDVTFCVKYKN